jgi:hypothetical protein
MPTINEKILTLAIIAVFYALTLWMKPQTVPKVIISTLLGIVTIIWALDFFGIYPYTKFLHLNNF